MELTAVVMGGRSKREGVARQALPRLSPGRCGRKLTCRSQQPPPAWRQQHSIATNQSESRTPSNLGKDQPEFPCRRVVGQFTALPTYGSVQIVLLNNGRARFSCLLK